MDELFGRMLLALSLVLGLLGGLTWFVKKYGTRFGLPALPQKGKMRLQLVEAAALDARHRLVLVRRDDVEHLLVLGGAQPVVVEAGICKEDR